ncbi:MAG: cytidylate kinase family protein [Candidatus Micrarchaeota archaeon]|nr:cytidylate kinase family protein [Candidatus Micrarchaeota archaeon]
MKAIIISGMPAAGKTTVANLLGKALGIRVVGMGDILKEMARERGYIVTGEDWWDTPPGIKFLKEREGNPELDKEADHKLIHLIETGDIILTSWTAPWIAQDGYKIWLDANAENRAERMAKRDNTKLSQAIKTTKVRDEENYKLYKRLYHFELGRDKSPFDLVINTNSIPPEEVTQIIIKHIKSKE